MATASLSEPRIGRDDPLDTTVRLVTPERVTFDYPLAGPFRRATSYLLDLFICVVVLVIAAMVASFAAVFQVNTWGLFLVVLFVVQWSFGAVWESLANGQTPGKMVLGTRVVSSNGTPITGAQAFLRNLTWPVEGMPLLALFPGFREEIPTLAFMPAIASMMLTKKFQRLGDLMAGTMVIVERRPAQGRVQAIKDRNVDAILAILPAKIDAGPDLARALADYAAARERFSTSQQEEMTAPLASPLRRRYGLPRATTSDAVVSAMYCRVFLGR